MEFTFDDYIKLLRMIFECGYEISGYSDWEKKKRCVILRHDIDYDIEKAVKFASIENAEGVFSTYFVLISSDFYNIFSKENIRRLKKIIGYGHDIGLHFDEVRYPELRGNINGLLEKIMWEAQLLEDAINRRVTTVSMHRPSREILEASIEIPSLINTYSKSFFVDFKYLSDSRRRWREPVFDIIKSGCYSRIHILTHAFWYCYNTKDLHETIVDFVNMGNYDRWKILYDNITDLESIMSSEEII